MTSSTRPRFGEQLQRRGMRGRGARRAVDFRLGFEHRDREPTLRERQRGNHADRATARNQYAFA